MTLNKKYFYLMTLMERYKLLDNNNNNNMPLYYLKYGACFIR